ncbi:MAG TPA: homoserine O-succinyltransferase [Caulobacteraceae bacterium]|nr:homoserine O-succinyltransferase [Caulobacteraceae bacterium]
MTALSRIAASGPAPRLTPRTSLTIGLLNNMPDAAMAATERQFGDLLRAAAGPVEIDLRLFALDSLPRGERVAALMDGRYESAAGLAGAELDGLIVTGNEPHAPELEQERYWPAMAAVIDWTRAAGVPTIWSCLAAHAAVLRLDSVRRRPLPAKLSGVFESVALTDDPLLAGAASPFLTPHSRQNGLAEHDLIRSGYDVLTRSTDAGVDAFVRREGALALFLQGHPEYDADTLKKEYLRDVGRFLRGERERHPPPPRRYFGRDGERALETLANYAIRRPSPDLLSLYAEVLADARVSQTWRASAIGLYHNWLAEAAGMSIAPVDRESV